MSRELNTVIIGHYPNDQQASMERFDALIQKQLHSVPGKHVVWLPPVVFGALKRSAYGLGKWLGYIDKFILFPLCIRWRLWVKLKDPKSILFIIPDHSLGIYLPIFRKYPHVVHLHDLIAIRAANDAFYGQKLSRSGRVYQNLISNGLELGKHFICISEASRKDLLQFISPFQLNTCEVIYNELNYPYQPNRTPLVIAGKSDVAFDTQQQPYLIHVGNSLWYKNRNGVLQIYSHLCSKLKADEIPHLVIVGEPATPENLVFIRSHGLQNQIHFFSQLPYVQLEQLYSQAIGLLFPSHHEGFGWPIIEALACGCPVMTTQRAPMTEVGASHANYIEPMPLDEDETKLRDWLDSAVAIIEQWIKEQRIETHDLTGQRVEYSKKFSVGTAFNAYLAIYQSIPESETK